MKMTIYILGVIAGLFLIIPLFTAKVYVIRKEIIIDKPASKIYDYLRHLKNHKNFNAWLLKDPNLKENFRGDDGQVGFVYSYEGNKDVGAGEQKLTGLEENKKVDIELHFIKPFKSTCQTPFDITALGEDRTKVIWTMKGHMNYPMNIALLFINIDSFLGKDVGKSLENLKRVLH